MQTTTHLRRKVLKLKIPALENITTDLINSAIKVPKVNYIHGVFAMSTVLKTSHIVNLKNTSLVRFAAAGNQIQRIRSGVLQNFPDSLNSASFRDNVLSVGFNMNDFKTLPITFFDASNTFYSHNVFTSFLEICFLPKHTDAMISDDNWLYVLLIITRTVNSIFLFQCRKNSTHF